MFSFLDLRSLNFCSHPGHLSQKSIIFSLQVEASPLKTLDLVLLLLPTSQQGVNSTLAMVLHLAELIQVIGATFSKVPEALEAFIPQLLIHSIE